jgi:hypothetical protein
MRELNQNDRASFVLGQKYAFGAVALVLALSISQPAVARSPVEDDTQHNSFLKSAFRINHARFAR